MKKLMTMLMASAMVLSMGVMASAAKGDYTINLDDKVLVLSNGEKTAKYQLDSSELVLTKSNDGGIAVSFRSKDDANKKVSLGEQKQVSVYGEVDYLNISKSLDKEFTVHITEDAEVDILNSAGKARINVDGEVDKAYLSDKGARFTANKGSDVDTVYAAEKENVKGLLSTHVKAYIEPEVVVGDDRDVYYHRYYNYNYGRYDLGVSGIVERNDRISFDCEVSGATVYLNGKKLGITNRGTNTFYVDNDYYNNDLITIEKDGYYTERIYLHGFYDYYYRDGHYYWRY